MLENFESRTFNISLHQSLQTKKGKPCNITFIPGTTLTAVHTPIVFPNHWRSRVKQNIDRGVALGIIQLIPVVNAPTQPGALG